MSITLNQKFVCDFENCKKEFTKKNNLIIHMRTHVKLYLNFQTGEKPHKCELCDKQFAAASNLINHKKTHLEEKRMKCTFDGCDKTFLSKCHLRTHLRTHVYIIKSSQIGLKPFECSVCGKRFSEKGNLKIHQRIHSDERLFTCFIEGCKMSFKTKAQLKDHINSHLKRK